MDRKLIEGIALNATSRAPFGSGRSEETATPSGSSTAS
jgi:hypothetical protein